MSIIYGLFKKNIFKDDKTGYARFYLAPKIKVHKTNMLGFIVCQGSIPYYKEDTPLRLDGEWDGDKFAVVSTAVYSENPTVIANYIYNNCSGFGQKLATDIANIFKGDLFSLLDVPDGAEVISEKVKGVSIKKANKLIEELQNITHQQFVFDFAAKYDINYSTLIKLDKFYGINLEAPLQNNPYKSGRLLDLPFNDTDNIAFYYNIEDISQIRIEALIYEALKMKANEGHTIANIDEVYNLVSYLSKKSKYKSDIPKILFYTTILQSRLVKYDDNVPNKLSLIDLDEAEGVIAAELKRLSMHTSKEFAYNDALITEYEALNSIILEKEQKASLNALKTPGIKIITGGPGTGKTTVIKAILHMFKSTYPNKTYVLCSPTGRAAQRMAETTMEEASTIHKTIDCKIYQNVSVSREHSNPIEADLLIVDEMSMVDVEVFSMLLKAVKNGAIVILIGDPDQLPSVGPGAVLKDLIATDCFETYRLNVCKRQKDGNVVIDNAIKIKNGETDLLTAKNFKIYKKKDSASMAHSVQYFYSTLFPYYDKLDLQILSSTKKHEAGTFAMNDKIQPIVNPSNVQFYYGRKVFKLHDKVMMLVNRSEYGYNNGDIGEIVAIEDTSFQVSINNTILTLDKGCANDMILAYSVTAHKSQGSEYDTAIIVVPKNPKTLLKRKVIFTEITRARNIIIFSEEDALEQAIANNEDENRQTTLQDKILALFTKRAVA